MKEKETGFAISWLKSKWKPKTFKCSFEADTIQELVKMTKDWVRRAETRQETEEGEKG